MRRLFSLTSVLLFLPLMACNAKDARSSEETKTSDVDLDAAKAAFGCDAPADAASKRACEGLAMFGEGQRVTSFPSEGTAVFLARRECSKDPNGMIHFAIAKLSPGGAIAHQFEAWPREPATELTAERITGDLARGGPPSQPSPKESEDGYAPKSLSSMQETWAMIAPVPLVLEETGGPSLLEQPERPSAGVAYWREAEGKPVRVAPPKGEFGWCVSVYYPVPE